MDAGMPMPALVSSMPMPSYGNHGTTSKHFLLNVDIIGLLKTTK
jgi:hypothetical protein